MKRPTRVSQGSLQRLVASAQESWKRSEFADAIATMERASRLNPSNPALLLELGRMQGLRFDFAAAERSFEQAIRVAPRKTEMLALAAANCRDFRNSDLAERYFRRAAEQPDVTPEILAELAEIHERARRRDDAAGLIERGLRQKPDCVAALLVRARLERQAGRLDAAEQILRALPAGAATPVYARASYELGTILDRQGRYDEAMSAFQCAKAILRPHADRQLYELKIIRDRIRHLITHVTPELIHQWTDASTLLQPPQRLVLLGGHPRSGTTLLEQVLDSHPDIISAEETEIFHNDVFVPLLRGHPDATAMFDGLAQATPEKLQSARRDYFRAMELALGQPIGTRWLVDKNPSYTFFAAAMARVFPEIKFLIALRDPRDVVLSCFMQPILPLNQTAAAFLTLEGAASEYGELMNAWLSLRPMLKNSFLEVKYEDMVEDLESVARRTLEFLAMPWDERVLGFDAHARQKIVRSPTYADVTQPVYQRARGRWHHYRKYLEPHLEKLEPFIKAFGYG